MQGLSIGGGLAALGFWAFIATVVVAGIWYAIREREARHQTLRHMLDKGEAIDDTVMDGLFSHGGWEERNFHRAMKLTGLVLVFVAVGLALFALLVGLQFAGWLLPLLGVAALVATVAVGMLVAASWLERWHKEDAASGSPDA